MPKIDTTPIEQVPYWKKKKYLLLTPPPGALNVISERIARSGIPVDILQKSQSLTIQVSKVNLHEVKKIIRQYFKEREAAENHPGKEY
jgi:hypothetical protein